MIDAMAGLSAHVSTSPLVWLCVTLGSFCACDAVSRRSGRHPLVNPVLMTVIVVSLVLVVTGTPYSAYFEGTRFIYFLLGPATVALAAPLYRHRQTIIRSLLPITIALGAGSLTAIISTIAIGELFSLPRNVIVSIAPKSATAAVSMAISTDIGGDATLTAITTILAGIAGAIIVTPLMNALSEKDWKARGFAVGIAAHGIGTARALQVHPLAGVFSGVAMGLNAVITALIVPLVLGWI